MFSIDFICRQQENLVDNQKCQAGQKLKMSRLGFLVNAVRSKLQKLVCSVQCNDTLHTKLQLLSYKERSCERVDYDQFLPRNGLFGSLQWFLNH